MPHKIATPIQMFVAPGPKPNGLQAMDDGLWYIDQENHHVYKLDWVTGATIISFPTETLNSSGITLGGGDLWIASTYSCEIFRVDAKTGKTLDKYPSPGAGINAPREHLADPTVTGAHGLEWDDENRYLYVAEPPSQYVHVMEAATWKEIHRFKVPGFRVHGIAWAKEDGHMWVSDTSLGTVTRHRIEDGRCYDSFRVPDTVEVHGMTIRDDTLWYADDRGPIGKLAVSMEPIF